MAITLNYTATVSDPAKYFADVKVMVNANGDVGLSVADKPTLTMSSAQWDEIIEAVSTLREDTQVA